MKPFFARIMSYVPTPLPVGKTEYNAWIASIIALAGNYATPDAMEWVISTNIMRLDPTTAFVSKHYFVRILRKAACNEIASNSFQEIKQRQQEAFEAAQKQPVEATTQPTVAPTDDTTQKA